LPTVEDTARLLEALKVIEPKKPEAVDAIFTEYVKHRRNSSENIQKLENFLTKIETFAEKIK